VPSHVGRVAEAGEWAGLQSPSTARKHPTCALPTAAACRRLLQEALLVRQLREEVELEAGRLAPEWGAHARVLQRAAKRSVAGTPRSPCAAALPVALVKATPCGHMLINAARRHHGSMTRLRRCATLCRRSRAASFPACSQAQHPQGQAHVSGASAGRAVWSAGVCGVMAGSGSGDGMHTRSCLHPAGRDKHPAGRVEGCC
jgi:hypothetical protein